MTAVLIGFLVLLTVCAFIPNYEDRQRIKWMMELQDNWEVQHTIHVLEAVQVQGILTDDEVHALERYKDLHRTPWGYRARRDGPRR